MHLYGSCNPALVPDSFGPPCHPPRQAHVVPNDGDLLTCVNIYSGLNRRVFNHGQCSFHELPNIVPVA